MAEGIVELHGDAHVFDAGPARSPRGTAGWSTVNCDEILASAAAFVAARGVR